MSSAHFCLVRFSSGIFGLFCVFCGFEHYKHQYTYIYNDNLLVQGQRGYMNIVKNLSHGLLRGF